MHFFFFLNQLVFSNYLLFYLYYVNKAFGVGGKGIATDSSKQCCQALLIETSRSQAEEQSQAKRGGGEERQREERSRGSTTV